MATGTDSKSWTDRVGSAAKTVLATGAGAGVGIAAVYGLSSLFGASREDVEGLINAFKDSGGAAQVDPDGISHILNINGAAVPVAASGDGTTLANITTALQGKGHEELITAINSLKDVPVDAINAQGALDLVHNMNNIDVLQLDKLPEHLQTLSTAGDNPVQYVVDNTKLNTALEVLSEGGSDSAGFAEHVKSLSGADKLTAILENDSLKGAATQIGAAGSATHLIAADGAYIPVKDAEDTVKQVLSANNVEGRFNDVLAKMEPSVDKVPLTVGEALDKVKGAGIEVGTLDKLPDGLSKVTVPSLVEGAKPDTWVVSPEKLETYVQTLPEDSLWRNIFGSSPDSLRGDIFGSSKADFVNSANALVSAGEPVSNAALLAGGTLGAAGGFFVNRAMKDASDKRADTIARQKPEYWTQVAEQNTPGGPNQRS